MRNKIISYLKAIIRILSRMVSFCFYVQREKESSTKETRVLLYDPSIDTLNSGDYIIKDYCFGQIKECIQGEFLSISTHKPEKKPTGKFEYQIVCGSNLLFPKMERQGQWNYPLQYRFLNHICLLGVGWYKYDDTEISGFSKLWYKKILENGMIHSVRDSYTESRLKSIGIENVLNTACPTMWNLTKEKCECIPHGKAKNVVTTVTDYRKDPKRDRYMFEVLAQSYEKVFVWLQGSLDKEYIDTLLTGFDRMEQIEFIPFELSKYDECLNSHDVDYVGTRLHAGIRALNFSRRTIIIAVDNRAVEISKDTNLPIIKRECCENELREYILGEFKTEIFLPEENIKRWKEQFS